MHCRTRVRVAGIRRGVGDIEAGVARVSAVAHVPRPVIKRHIRIARAVTEGGVDVDLGRSVRGIECSNVQRAVFHGRVLADVLFSRSCT